MSHINNLDSNDEYSLNYFIELLKWNFNSIKFTKYLVHFIETLSFSEFYGAFNFANFQKAFFCKLRLRILGKKLTRYDNNKLIFLP